MATYVFRTLLFVGIVAGVVCGVTTLPAVSTHGYHTLKRVAYR